MFDDENFFEAADQDQAPPDAMQALGLIVCVPALTPAENDGRDELREWELAFRKQKQRYAVIFDEGEPQPMPQEQY